MVVQQPLYGLHPVEYTLCIVKPVHPENKLSVLGEVLQETANRGLNLAQGHLAECLGIGAHWEMSPP